MAHTITTAKDGHLHADEKLEATRSDHEGSETSALSEDAEYTLDEQKKIIHRVDRRLVVACGIMYCVSLMDRTNLGQAAIAGMTSELRLTVGFRYVELHALL